MDAFSQGTIQNTSSLYCINPLTPGAFCKRHIFWTFWRFSGWISAKLALIWWKLHLQHGSLPFLPLASHFMTFWLRHVLKSKFCVWEEKVTYVLRLFDFEFFFFTFPFSPFLFFLLQWLTFYWACLRLKTSKKVSSRQAIFAMKQPGVVAGNFALSFSLNFLSIFVHISNSIKPVTVIWASLKRCFPPAQVEYRWCQFWSKGMTSERQRLITAS